MLVNLVPEFLATLSAPILPRRITSISIAIVPC